ncbi:MAG: UPF0280 family protein [Granulosicoccus sp.]
MAQGKACCEKPARGTNGAEAWLLPDGRLHLQHGPIDLLIEADGSALDRQRAYSQATRKFSTVLEQLVEELVDLRRPLTVNTSPQFAGVVARRMLQAVAPYAGQYITPMACVAGAVADHILSVLLANTDLNRVHVNNGGDIALYLAGNEHYRIGICRNPQDDSAVDEVRVRAGEGIGGVATSGWRGRSHSLGIADAVTVLASTAAMADVAATVIANAVDVPDSVHIKRASASSLDSDSDLAAHPVTVEVATLGKTARKSAIRSAVHVAECLLRDGLIHSAYIQLQGDSAVVDRRSVAYLPGKSSACFHPLPVPADLPSARPSLCS